MSSKDNYQILNNIENVTHIIFSDSKVSEWRGEEIMATKDRYPETPRNLEACEGRICTFEFSRHRNLFTRKLIPITNHAT